MFIMWLNQGIGINLQTLLLDENMIAASGATALGVGLRRCEKLRELGVARNPLGRILLILILIMMIISLFIC